MAKQPEITVSVAGDTAAVAAVLAVADDLATRGQAIEDRGYNGSIYSNRNEGRAAGYLEAARLIRAAVKDSLPKEPEYAHCAHGGCSRQWEVSDEDPDATMGDMLEHAQRVHPQAKPENILKQGRRP